MSLDTNIKVMYLNPIGNSDYDQVFADMAKKYKYPATAADVVSMNPDSVPPKMNNLEFRTYEAFIIRDTVEAARYASKNGYDAMVIGCFYDPALDDAREIASIPVVAPCQAACEVALNLANNFSIIIGQSKWEDQMRQAVYNYGYKDKLASFQAIGMGWMISRRIRLQRRLCLRPPPLKRWSCTRRNPSFWAVRWRWGSSWTSKRVCARYSLTTSR